MFYVVHLQKVLFYLVLTFAIIGCMLYISSRTFVRSVSNLSSQPVVEYVIDAGHGGEDGGAIAQDGTVESALNLEIAQKVDALLGFTGHSAKMTRETEAAIYDEGCRSLREKKRSDLRNRVAFIENTNPKLVISIHQNSFPDAPQVHGVQTFYNHINPADEYALSMQAALNLLQTSRKDSKKISESIYLMREITVPAVLVECGFLSNCDETNLLKTADHQKNLTVAMVSGILCDRNEENYESK